MRTAAVVVGTALIVGAVIALIASAGPGVASALFVFGAFTAIVGGGYGRF